MTELAKDIKFPAFPVPAPHGREAGSVALTPVVGPLPVVGEASDPGARMRRYLLGDKGLQTDPWLLERLHAAAFRPDTAADDLPRLWASPGLLAGIEAAAVAGLEAREQSQPSVLGLEQEWPSAAWDGGMEPIYGGMVLDPITVSHFADWDGGDDMGWGALVDMTLAPLAATPAPAAAQDDPRAQALARAFRAAERGPHADTLRMLRDMEG